MEGINMYIKKYLDYKRIEYRVFTRFTTPKYFKCQNGEGG